MNTWRDRLFVALLLVLFQLVHGEVNGPLPNTPAWALFLFGSAAALEYIVFRIIPYRLDGRLCDHMQVLAGVCIVTDALGFLGYMAKYPSVYYNTAMWVLSSVQWARLLFVDGNHARAMGSAIFRGLTSGRALAHFQTAKR